MTGAKTYGVLSAAHFGAVVSMDYIPALQIMLLCPLPEQDQLVMAGTMQVWRGLVLSDDPASRHSWPLGSIITLAPGASGVNVIEHAEDL